jgi:hypothetical protein
VTFKTELDPQLGTVQNYPQEFARALLNVIAHGFYPASERKSRDSANSPIQPKVTLSTKGLPDSVELRVRDNGLAFPMTSGPRGSTASSPQSLPAWALGWGSRSVTTSSSSSTEARSSRDRGR